MLTALALALSLATPFRAALGPDPSPHQRLAIRVAPKVELEVLDWGGSGPTLVFLAGYGNSAHIYDGFAPEFTSYFRVLGVTRRGFGASSKPRAGYDTTTLVRDIVAVLDSLGIARASLVAHSFGGSELNYLAARFPQRVHRLVYLDAAVDHRQLYDSLDWLSAYPTPEPPYPTYGDNDNSISAWRWWAERLAGPGYPRPRSDRCSGTTRPTLSLVGRRRTHSTVSFSRAPCRPG